MSILFGNKSKINDSIGVSILESYETPASIYLDFIEESTSIMNALYVADVMLETTYHNDHNLEKIAMEAANSGWDRFVAAVKTFWKKIVDWLKNAKNKVMDFFKKLFKIDIPSKLAKLVEKEKELIKSKGLPEYTFKTALNLSNDGGLPSVEKYTKDYNEFVKKGLGLWREWLKPTKSGTFTATKQLAYPDEVKKFNEDNKLQLISSDGEKLKEVEVSFVKDSKILSDFMGSLSSFIRGFDNMINTTNTMSVLVNEYLNFIDKIVKNEEHKNSLEAQNSRKMITTTQEAVNGLIKWINLGSTQVQMAANTINSEVNKYATYIKSQGSSSSSKKEEKTNESSIFESAFNMV